MDEHDTLTSLGGVKIETDALGGITIITPREIAEKQRERALLLQPDHSCTGAGGMGVRADGSHFSYHRPCSGCEAQRKRLEQQRPDLFPKPEPPLYDRIEGWLRDFYKKAATKQNGTPEYYEAAASGLSIALQEIDRERFDRTGGDIWKEYQAMKEAHDA